MKNILLLSVLMLFVNPLKAALPVPAHRVVFQMTSSDLDEHQGLINNINNLINVWNEDVLIHVVIHGPGVALVQAEKTTHKEALYALIARGVVFQVCENTLKQKHIDKSEILDYIQYVPSGIVAIIEKQEQGWSYIKSNF